MSKKRKKPGEWIDNEKNAKIIFDGSYRRVKFNDGRIGLAAMTVIGLDRLTNKYYRGNMRNFDTKWWDGYIFMAIQQ